MAEGYERRVIRPLEFPHRKPKSNSSVIRCALRSFEVGKCYLLVAHLFGSHDEIGNKHILKVTDYFATLRIVKLTRPDCFGYFTVIDTSSNTIWLFRIEKEEMHFEQPRIFRRRQEEDAVLKNSIVGIGANPFRQCMVCPKALVVVMSFYFVDKTRTQRSHLRIGNVFDCSADVLKR